MAIDIVLKLWQGSKIQVVNSKVWQYVVRNWMSTARYLLWGQIQYEDVNEQRNGQVEQPVKVLWSKISVKEAQ